MTLPSDVSDHILNCSTVPRSITLFVQYRHTSWRNSASRLRERQNSGLYKTLQRAKKWIAWATSSSSSIYLGTGFAVCQFIIFILQILHQLNNVHMQGNKVSNPHTSVRAISNFSVTQMPSSQKTKINWPTENNHFHFNHHFPGKSVSPLHTLAFFFSHVTKDSAKVFLKAGC